MLPENSSHVLFTPFNGKLWVDLLKDFNYLGQHPAVSECAVMGLPDEDYGEAVSAVIVLEASAREAAGSKPALTLKELRSWSKDKLAPYKVRPPPNTLFPIALEISLSLISSSGELPFCVSYIKGGIRSAGNLLN